MYLDLKAAIAATVALAFAVGCAATTIQVPRLKPAEVNLGPVKKVAIGKIEGAGGEDVSDRLTQAIMACGKYEVLDRQHMDAIAKEKQLSADDPGAGYGPVLGAAALIFGRITKDGWQEGVTADQQTCQQGKQSFPCTTYTRAGQHTTAVNFKILSAVSGKVLATKLITGAAGTKKEVQVQDVKTTNALAVASIIPPIDNPEGFRDGAIAELVTDFMKMIAPYTITVSVVLYEQKSPASKVGVSAAKAGNWAAAIDAFKTALQDGAADEDPEVPARAHYNLGVALGYAGSYDEGVAEIQKAMNAKPDDVFQREIRSIQQFRMDDANLKAQGG